MKTAFAKEILFWSLVCYLAAASGVCNGQPTLDDIKQRLGSRNSIYAEADLIGYAHEGAHGVNSIIRERRAGTNAAYIGNGEYVQLPEPNVTLEIVRQYVPFDYQGQFYRYLHSGSSWQNNPLYVLDEWTAYYAGSKTGRELGGEQIQGRLNGSDEGLRACCMFGSALVEAVAHYDSGYSHKAELAAFVAKLTALSAAVLGDIPQQAVAQERPKPRRLSQVGGGKFTANSYETDNFIVYAPRNIAQQVGDTAEHWRFKHAVEWFGEEMPSWSKKCPVTVKCNSSLGSGGATSFVFDRGEVGNWNMRVQGSLDRLLDSVVPHEVLHTVFATKFRQPIPRWADEGACSIVESESEVAECDQMLYQFLKTGRGLRFSEMMLMRDYPSDYMPLYAQGASVAKWLIDKHGRDKFIEFVSATLDDSERNDIEQTIREQFGYQDIAAMQSDWMGWISQGSPLEYKCGYGPSVCSSGDCGNANAVVIAPSQHQITPMSYVDPRWTEWRGKVETNIDVKLAANLHTIQDTIRRDNEEIAKLRQEWDTHLKKYGEIKSCQCDKTQQSANVNITNALTQINQRIVSIEQKLQQPAPPAEPASPQISYYDIVPRKQ